MPGPTDVYGARTNVDWAAVFAGAALATATALILLAFGATLGLNAVSPYAGDDPSPIAYVIGAGLWMLWVQLLSFSFGGYVATRVRTEATEHETDVRDGLHGVLVWATGVIAAAVIAFVGIGGITAAARTADSRSDLAASVSTVVTAQVNESAAKERVTEEKAADSTATQRRAEVARKLTVISAFITAASLLAGLVAAFIFGGIGGRHRDDGGIVHLFELRKHSKLW
jgi:hypothetical protein